jgi:head-tail adaptor
MIGPKTAVGARPHRVQLLNPGPAVSDHDGGTTQSWFTLTPAFVDASIRPPTGQDLERLAAGTVIATALRVITFPFHPQVTMQTRVRWTDRVGRLHTASVTGVDNPDDRCVETVCLCVELLDAPLPVVDPGWIQTGWLQ